MPSLRLSPLHLLAVLALVPALACTACTRKDKVATNDAAVSASASTPTVSGESAATSASASAATSPSAATSASAAPKKVVSAAPLGVECRATHDGGLIELDLRWDKDTAKGTLRTDGKSRPVIAELYKGLVLVDAPGTPSPLRGNVATVSTNGKKTIRIGDYKQPSYDCH